MDELIQQECLVESQIETYKSQLSLVEQQLEFGGHDADTSDLQQLKSDLSELISLTQDSLLEIKKQKLLLVFQGAIATPSPAPSSSSSSSITTLPTQPKVMCGNGTERGAQQEGREEKREDEEEQEEEEDDLLGTRCKAPLKEAWGAINYHNAIIISREMGSSSSPDHSEEKLVTVLFTHPIYNAMKPCPFYLEGKCNFDEQSCKFSHGHVVPFSELQPFQDPDFSLAHVGGKSLAKYTDGLWHPAIISAVGELFTVHFSTLNATAQLEPDCVLPLESSDESDSSESDSSSEEEEEEGVRILEWKPTGAQQALGEWEKYTTGIGSRLLAKMGYVVGKGLGKDGQGQVDPVEIVILPVRKSLDVCAEMREAKKLRKPLGQAATKRKKKRVLGNGSHQQQQQSEEGDIFNFLNTKIFRKDHKASEEFQVSKDSKPRSSSQRGRENLNVKLFKVHEEMKSVKKRMQSLQKSLLRQKGSRDTNMEAHVQEKLATCERHLSQLRREEQTIQRNITSKSERKKLTVF